MNTVFQPIVQKQKPKVYQNDSILESMRHVGSSVTSTVMKDVTGKVASDALAALLGQVPQKSPEGERDGGMIREQPISPFRQPEVSPSSIAEFDAMHVRQQLQAVRAELKALSESIKNFHQEVEKAISEVPVNPGVYHVNFLERLRSVLKILREQIEDSRTWLTLSTGRKQKKMYWGLYKKHGTQFGLSSERTLATQAG